jgi:radical SAM protein (TIGR01212 family)
MNKITSIIFALAISCHFVSCNSSATSSEAAVANDSVTNVNACPTFAYVDMDTLQVHYAYYQDCRSELEKIYKQALEVDGVIGIVVGTRPDCIDEEKLALLKEFNKTHYVMIEYGVESVYDETLKRINRGHDFETAKKAICLTHEFGLPCGGHFIFGLPGESREMMINAADIISELPLTTVKFHQLQIFKDTIMAEEYLNNPEAFHLFTLEDYIEFVIDFTERLNPDLVIERFAGEVPPRYLISKPWMNLRYDEVLNLIEKRMEERDTFQGKKFRI